VPVERAVRCVLGHPKEPQGRSITTNVTRSWFRSLR
jgi:hypothetical protein